MESQGLIPFFPQSAVTPKPENTTISVLVTALRVLIRLQHLAAFVYPE